jgi:hypothetical protein
MSQVAEMVGHRSELLARVALTRRLNIDVFDFDLGGEMGIDLLCAIRDTNVPGFLPFGVLVWGTAEPLDTPTELARHVRNRRRKLEKRPRYFMPVIVLLFSMHNDEAYFAWLVEPSETTAQLVDVAEPEFKTFDVKQLDRITRRITHWYKRLAVDIRPDTAEIYSSQCPNDE